MVELLSEIGTILLLIAICGTKFLTGPAVVLAAGYPMIPTMIITFVGGSIGSIFFFRLGTTIFNWWQRIFPPKKKKKIFSKKNRTIVRFKNKFGVMGLALLVPLISIPISCFIAAKYFRHDRRAIPSYIIAVAGYSVILTLFSDPIIQLIKNAF